MKILSTKSSNDGASFKADDSGRWWPRLFTIEATDDGKRYEFTRFQGGAWECYDHPKNYRGVPRFVGYLPSAVADKLIALVRAQAKDVSMPRLECVQNLRSHIRKSA